MFYFFAGIVTITIIIPALKGLSDLIEYEAEYLYSKISVKIYKLKKEIEEDQDQGEINAIGFQIDTPPDEDMPEEEG